MAISTEHNISNEDLSRLLVPGSEWESFLSAKEYVREYCFSLKKSVFCPRSTKKYFIMKCKDEKCPFRLRFAAVEERVVLKEVELLHKCEILWKSDRPFHLIYWGR